MRVRCALVLMAMLVASLNVVRCFGQAPYGLRIVAYTNEAAPGPYGSSTTDGNFQAFGIYASQSYSGVQPTIGDAGGVLFDADTDNPDQGWWQENPGPGNLYNAFSLNSSGAGLTQQQWMGRSGTGYAVVQDATGTWQMQLTTSSGTLQSVASDANPQAAGGYLDFELPTMSSAGSVAYENLDSTVDARKVYHGGTTSTLAVAGQSVPVLSGTTFGSQLTEAAINAANNVAFTSGLNGSISGNGLFKGTLSGGSYALQPVAYTGMTAPNTSGAVFDFIGSRIGPGDNKALLATQGFNDAGQTVFAASLQHTGSIGSTNDHGVWTDASGSLRAWRKRAQLPCQE